MRSKEKKKCLLATVLTILAVPLYGAWQTETNISNDSDNNDSTSWNNVKCIVAVYGTPPGYKHIVWTKEGSDIYYKRKGGLMEPAPAELSDDQYDYRYAQIVRSGDGALFVAWKRVVPFWPEYSSSIVCRRSTDEGVSWESQFSLNTDNGCSRFCILDDRDGDTLHIFRAGRKSSSPWTAYLIYERWIKFNGSWWPNLTCTLDSNVPKDMGEEDAEPFYFFPSAARWGDTLYLAYSYEKDTSNGVGWYSARVKFTRSTNKGTTWSTPVTLSPAYLFDSPLASIAAHGSNVAVVYRRGWINADYEDTLYTCWSTNAGSSWSSECRLATSGIIAFPNAIMAGDTLAVVWEDYRNGNYDIYGRSIVINTLNPPSNGSQITTSNNFDIHPSVAYSNNMLYLVWTRLPDDAEVYYNYNDDAFPLRVGDLGEEGFSPTGESGKDKLRVFGLNISFDLQEESPVSLSVYTADGRLVKSLVSGTISPGEHSFSWQAPAKGIYIIVLQDRRATWTSTIFYR